MKNNRKHGNRVALLPSEATKRKHGKALTPYNNNGTHGNREALLPSEATKRRHGKAFDL